jgi:hypothetical protein
VEQRKSFFRSAASFFIVGEVGIDAGAGNT